MSIAPLVSTIAPAPTGKPAAAPVSLDAVRSLVRGLSREQRQAVMHGTGPLLVLAGPGTGKTEVVTRRVARLIAAKLALPREILALTFTDNAAQEMQARVDLLVPYGQADAGIHTFHAFGDRLLRDHAFDLGRAGDVRLINRPEAIVLLRENLFELGLERYIPLADPTRFLGALVDLFGRAKDCGLTPLSLQQNADELFAEIARDDASDAELADLAGSRAELARAFDAYERLLASHGLIDHADQIALPLRLLRERPAVRAEIQQRYRFVLVDELQDANATQLEFVLAVTALTGNVCVVGDPNQGIYDFRGASSENVSRFASTYPALRRIVLRRNYRSRTPIVDASRKLIANNHPADEDGPAQLSHRRSRSDHPVRVRAFETWSDECDAVAADIAGRLAGGARPHEFAVLVRTNAETFAVLRSLLALGVPATNGARPDLLRLPAVRSLMAFLRVVADSSNNLELFALATGEPYRLTAAELSPFTQAARRRSRSLWEIVVAAASDPATSDPDVRRRLDLLVGHVRRGIDASARRTSGEVLYEYMQRSGTLARLAVMTENGEDVSGLRGIARFAALVRGRASLLAHDRVPFLVPHLERLTEDETALDADGPAPDEVNVLTVHRAKGLQFKVVFLAGLVDGRFPIRARRQLLDLPPELMANSADRVELAEERRLFYVAMTRARDELWLSYHTGDRGRRRPSPFIAEAVDMPRISASATPSLMKPLAVQRLEAALNPSPMPEIPPKQLSGPLSLSFSQVDEYVTCPERYRLRYVVGLSTPAHHALAYGSALHQAIAAFHASQGAGKPLAEEQLLGEFDRHWKPDGFLSREHEEARYAAGRRSLSAFRTRELASGRVPVAIERPFRFRLGSDHVVGRIDRLDREPDGVVITDYKSSDVREQKRADSRARDSLQLQVYALAHEAETGTLPARVQLHFIDSGVTGSVAPDPGRLAKARATLTTAAAGIHAGQFTPRPNPLACGYCPFRDICPQSAA